MICLLRSISLTLLCTSIHHHPRETRPLAGKRSKSQSATTADGRISRRVPCENDTSAFARSVIGNRTKACLAAGMLGKTKEGE